MKGHTALLNGDGPPQPMPELASVAFFIPGVMLTCSVFDVEGGGIGCPAGGGGDLPSSAQVGSVLGSWGKTTRDAARNKKRRKRRRTPIQDPSTHHLPSRTG